MLTDVFVFIWGTTGRLLPAFSAEYKPQEKKKEQHLQHDESLFYQLQNIIRYIGYMGNVHYSYSYI